MDVFSIYLHEVYCRSRGDSKFADERVKAFFERGNAAARFGWTNVAQIVARKLDMLEYATELRDLRSPPGNRLEALKGSWTSFTVFA